MKGLVFQGCFSYGYLLPMSLNSKAQKPNTVPEPPRHFNGALLVQYSGFFGVDQRVVGGSTGEPSTLNLRLII